MTATVTAPPAPGKLGQAIPADQLLGYLDALRRWRDGRQGELDTLDRAALAAAEPDAHTPDLTLAMVLFQAVSDRYDQLVTVWDSGRVLGPERERMSQLIWGRLDGAGLSVSLVEALTLSDALASRLRTRLALDPLAGVGERLAAVRAAVERSRDLITANPTEHDASETAAVQALRRRVDDLAGRAARGADVEGPLAVLETDVARVERDLIVGGARRRSVVRDRDEALALTASLEAREQPLRELAARCHDKIANAPRLAVPDVSKLGPVPTDRAGLDTHVDRLHRVAAALTYAEDAYGAPLSEREELRGRLHGYRAMAQAAGTAERADLLAAWDDAHGILWSAPCDLVAARLAVGRFQQLARPPARTDRTIDPPTDRPIDPSAETPTA
jgi:hypothetical protein